MNPQDEVADVEALFRLIKDQTETLTEAYLAATEPNRRVHDKADVANFILYHALHIAEMGKAALTLTAHSEPYSIPILARSALESAFNLVAAGRDPDFGPQRIALELEDLAKQIVLLEKKGLWEFEHPTPEECRDAAVDIRLRYCAPELATQGQKDRIDKIIRIAEVGELSHFYDSDYRPLSLTVHSNKAGIFNSASGVLVRKGMLAISTAAILATSGLCNIFGLEQFRSILADHLERHEKLALVPYDPKKGDSA